MADRCTLHISHLPKFKEWLQEQGWSLLPLSNNKFEVLRAKRDNKTLVIYKKMNAKEHLSIMDKDWWLVREFIKTMKGVKA